MPCYTSTMLYLAGAAEDVEEEKILELGLDEWAFSGQEEKVTLDRDKAHTKKGVWNSTVSVWTWIFSVAQKQVEVERG